MSEIQESVSAVAEPVAPTPVEEKADPKALLRAQISESMKDSANDPKPALESPGETRTELSPAVKEEVSKLPKEIQEAIQKKDLPAIADFLGLDEKSATKFFGMDNADWTALRFEQKKTKKIKNEAVETVTKLKTELQEKEAKLIESYGDPYEARKAWKSGNTYSFFETVAKWAEVPVVDVMKAWHQEIQGKPTKDLQEKAELLELRRQAAANKPQETAKEEPVVITAEKARKAMEYVETEISGDKLSKIPGMSTLVHDYLKKNWRVGTMDTPMKALAVIRKSFDDLSPAETSKKSTMEKSPARRGSDGRFQQPDSGRPMTVPELAKSVLSEFSKKDLWSSSNDD